MSEEKVRDALRAVIDPEVGLDVVTMGLIYDVELDGGTARITYTLTTPGCPLEQHMTGGIVAAVSGVPGIEKVEPRLVWEPRWDPAMIEEGAW